MLCTLECACLHKTVNMVVFFLNVIKRYLPKRESTHAKVQSYPYNEKRELRLGTSILMGHQVKDNQSKPTVRISICLSGNYNRRQDLYVMLACVCLIDSGYEFLHFELKSPRIENKWLAWENVTKKKICQFNMFYELSYTK